ncbi:MAG TPA: hypothetical protein VEL76_01875, partial [Gemmataceae bacterium]|nr:hypothetical protein [Gemmataceae bacterium]
MGLTLAGGRTQAPEAQQVGPHVECRRENVETLDGLFQHLHLERAVVARTSSAKGGDTAAELEGLQFFEYSRRQGANDR